MIIDRYFNPDENAYSVAAGIIMQLKNAKEENLNDFLYNIELKYPDTYDNYLFEALGLLFLTDKIKIKNDIIRLSV